MCACVFAPAYALQDSSRFLVGLHPWGITCRRRSKDGDGGSANNVSGNIDKLLFVDRSERNHSGVDVIHGVPKRADRGEIWR